MTTEHHSVQYGEHRIDFAVVRRDRTTLEIAVEPDATVVIAAPLDASLAAIEAKVRKRAAWIRRQQRYFIQFLPRTADRQYVAGETHLYLGRQYRLKVVPHVQATVKLIRGFIVVQTHRPSRTEVTRELVEHWYRERRAHTKFAERMEVNLLRFPGA
jgi:predicted metal-dependent hydrolase